MHDDGKSSVGDQSSKPLSTYLSEQVTASASDVLSGHPRSPIRDGAWAAVPTVALARQLVGIDSRFHNTPTEVASILAPSQTAPAKANTGTSMAMISDIDYQLELLAQLDGELQRVQDDMEGMVALYRQRLGQLAEAGMVPQLWNDFHDNVFEETRADFARLRDKIQVVDRVKVREYIARVEGLRP